MKTYLCRAKFEQLPVFVRLVGIQIYMSRMNMPQSFPSDMMSPVFRLTIWGLFFVRITS